MNGQDATPRLLFERRQREWLHPAAVRESGAWHRRHAEPQDPRRTCFQRDRDRVLHCSAFRRLDFKTQVFVPHQHDHYRTRMTHTLEVAHVARDIARALRLNEDLCEAVALAHDLGHPPFGHGGEDVLNELMAGRGGFEHNRQSLRIVDYLEHPYPHWRGLNLTTAVRECLAGHQAKDGAPPAEFDPALHPPLEGQLVDVADEIAYTSADLEDALHCGYLRAEQLVGVRLWRRAWDRAASAAPHAREVHLRIRATKAVLSLMATDLAACTQGHLDAAEPKSVDDVRHAGSKLVGFSQAMREEVRELKKFLLDEVYTAGANAEMDAEAGRILRELFAAFASEPTLLPDRYAGRIDSDGLHRVVCDYIAGMTDRYCRKEYERVCEL